MLGENLTYTNDVPPALSSESNYSLAFNMDIDEELPDTCGLMIPEPTPYINGEYDADGNYGWTLEFWVKLDTSERNKTMEYASQDRDNNITDSWASDAPV